jgi:hypothetical protein
MAIEIEGEAKQMGQISEKEGIIYEIPFEGSLEKIAKIIKNVKEGAIGKEEALNICKEKSRKIGEAVTNAYNRIKREAGWEEGDENEPQELKLHDFRNTLMFVGSVIMALEYSDDEELEDEIASFGVCMDSLRKEPLAYIESMNSDAYKNAVRILNEEFDKLEKK